MTRETVTEVQESNCALGIPGAVVHSDVVPAKLQLVQKSKRWSEISALLAGADTSRARKREQVAAVCYRIHKLRIEFLLVKTRKGKWTFPKGGVVRGFSRAQSAALEAFEEAGVHGRIEQAAFARYVLRKSGRADQTVTHAHLCEVLRLSEPQEADRSPSWVSAEVAQARLQQGRSREDGDELRRVLMRAVARIERLSLSNGKVRDGLQTVQVESADNTPARFIARVALVPYLESKHNGSVIELDADSPKTLRLHPPRTTD